MTFEMPSAPKPTSFAPRGFFSMILGRPGSGKSTLAAHFPDPVVVCDFRDQGMLDLAYEGLLPPILTPEKITVCDTFDSYKAALTKAVHSSHRTIICESLIGVQMMCESMASVKDYDNDWSDKKFYNYQAGPRTGANKYYQQLHDLMLLAQSKGKHVLFIGHIATGMEKNILGSDFLAGRVSASKAMSEKIQASFSNVFVIVNEAELSYDKGTYKSNKTTNRMCYAHECSEYPSKNRLQITAPFDLNGTPAEVYQKFCAKTRRDPKTGFRNS